MPWLIMALIGGLSRFVPYMVARVLVALGLGVVTFTMFSYIQQGLVNTFTSMQGYFVGDALTLLKMGGIIGVMQLWVSAYAVRVSLDAAKKVIQKL